MRELEVEEIDSVSGAGLRESLCIGRFLLSINNKALPLSTQKLNR